MSQSQRNGTVTLLPKKDKDPLVIKSYRPISLLTVDYKIIANTLANRVKKITIVVLLVVTNLALLRGGGIGSNIRLIMDVIEYTDVKQIPGAMLMLDIEKAFGSVNHNLLINALERFNFGDKFTQWVEMLYLDRNSYAIDNGFLIKSFSMKKGIFRGCLYFSVFVSFS